MKSIKGTPEDYLYCSIPVEIFEENAEGSCYMFENLTKVKEIKVYESLFEEGLLELEITPSIKEESKGFISVAITDEVAGELGAALLQHYLRDKPAHYLVELIKKIKAIQ